jgi:hypothetical protein
LEKELQAASCGPKFPYPASPAVRDVMHRLHEQGPPSELRPALPQHRCGCNLHYDESGYELLGNAAVHCLGPHYTRQLRHYVLQCPARAAGCMRRVDASALGLYMHSDTVFVALRRLYDCVDLFTEQGRSVKSFVRTVQSEYRYAPEGTPSFLSPNLFRKIYYVFVAALQREFLFQCPICRDCPDVLIGDATAETMRSEFYFGEPITQAAPSLELKRGAGNDRNSRRFVHNASLSSLLRDYAGHVSSRGDAIPPDCPLLQPVPGLDWLADICRAIDVIRFLPGALQPPSPVVGKVARMLAALGSDSPVAAYVPLSAAAAVAEHLRQPIDLHERLALTHTLRQRLQLEAPILYDFLCVYWQFGASLQHADHLAFHQFLTHLTHKVMTLVDAPGAGPSLPNPFPPSSTNFACLSSGVCSGLPRVRERYVCDMDSRPGDKPDCKHSFAKSGDRTGGVFTWFCKHGICYAFYIIPKAEGRNEAYSFLVSHFRRPPKVVVYDFACSLQDYCLNRAPGFFANTLFVIDRFHWSNHVSCCAGYDIDRYSLLRYLNTEIAEQCNSALQYIKPSVSRCKQRSFMLLMRLFLDAWNERKIIKLDRARAHAQALAS